MAVQVTAKDQRHVLKYPFLDQLHGAPAGFFRRLEDQPHRKRGRIAVGQQHGGPQQYAGVAIVGAGVHYPVHLGGEGQAGLLPDG